MESKRVRVFGDKCLIVSDSDLQYAMIRSFFGYVFPYTFLKSFILQEIQFETPLNGSINKNSLYSLTKTGFSNNKHALFKLCNNSQDMWIRLDAHSEFYFV